MGHRPRISPRFTLLFAFSCWFIILSLVLRIVFFVWQKDEVSWNIIDILRTLMTGLFFDIGTISFLLLPSAMYYCFIPQKQIGSWLDKIFVWLFTILGLFILIFTFFAEITFWEEFRNRFNFIAVDYLIYTHEVVANIEQSYPLPLLVGGVALITIIVLLLFYSLGVFRRTFSKGVGLKDRVVVLSVLVVICVFFTAFITNVQAEWSSNRYNSEISKSGIYSFFAAFRNNQMKYTEFYSSEDNATA